MATTGALTKLSLGLLCSAGAVAPLRAGAPRAVPRLELPAAASGAAAAARPAAAGAGLRLPLRVEPALQARLAAAQESDFVHAMIGLASPWAPDASVAANEAQAVVVAREVLQRVQAATGERPSFLRFWSNSAVLQLGATAAFMRKLLAQPEAEFAAIPRPEAPRLGPTPVRADASQPLDVARLRAARQSLEKGLAGVPGFVRAGRTDRALRAEFADDAALQAARAAGSLPALVDGVPVSYQALQSGVADPPRRAPRTAAYAAPRTDADPERPFPRAALRASADKLQARLASVAGFVKLGISPRAIRAEFADEESLAAARDGGRLLDDVDGVPVEYHAARGKEGVSGRRTSREEAWRAIDQNRSFFMAIPGVSHLGVTATEPRAVRVTFNTAAELQAARRAGRLAGSISGGVPVQYRVRSDAQR
ncbi:MAG: hypothetical protein HY554_18895 [Elusimicrobia bacterium]|nr:hypothetical protein [Elusimicrobiota bacterium]